MINSAKITNEVREKVLSIISVTLIGYGLLLCETDRTEITIFINSVSLLRIAQGAGLASIGWFILLAIYCFKDEQPQRRRKERRKR